MAKPHDSHNEADLLVSRVESQRLWPLWSARMASSRDKMVRSTLSRDITIQRGIYHEMKWYNIVDITRKRDTSSAPSFHNLLVRVWIMCVFMIKGKILDLYARVEHNSVPLVGDKLTNYILSARHHPHTSCELRAAAQHQPKKRMLYRLIESSAPTIFFTEPIYQCFGRDQIISQRLYFSLNSGGWN